MVTHKRQPQPPEMPCVCAKKTKDHAPRVRETLRPRQSVESQLLPRQQPSQQIHFGDDSDGLEILPHALSLRHHRGALPFQKSRQGAEGRLRGDLDELALLRFELLLSLPTNPVFTSVGGYATSLFDVPRIGDYLADLGEVEHDLRDWSGASCPSVTDP